MRDWRFSNGESAWSTWKCARYATHPESETSDDKAQSWVDKSYRSVSSRAIQVQQEWSVSETHEMRNLELDFGFVSQFKV